MRILKDFKDETEQEKTIAEIIAQGGKIIEIQHHLDGWHILYEGIPEPIRDLAVEIDKIRAKLEEKGIL